MYGCGNGGGGGGGAERGGAGAYTGGVGAAARRACSWRFNSRFSSWSCLARMCHCAPLSLSSFAPRTTCPRAPSCARDVHALQAREHRRRRGGGGRHRWSKSEVLSELLELASGAGAAACVGRRQDGSSSIVAKLALAKALRARVPVTCVHVHVHVHWCVSDRLSIGLLTDTRTEARLVLRNRFVDTSRCGSHIQKLMPKECRGASKHAQAIDAALAPRRRNRRSEVRAAALFDAAASSASARATARRPHVAASALAKPRASLGRAALQLPWSRALTWSPSWCGSPSRRTPCRRHSAATAAAAPA